LISTNPFGGEKVINKRKIVVIWIIFLFLTTSMVTVHAADTTKKEEIEESISVEIGTIGSDGEISKKTIDVTSEELIELENTVSNVMNLIKKIKNLDFLWKIIQKYFDGKDTLFGQLFGLYSGLKIIKKRAFVMSSGRGIDYSPLKKISFKFRKTARIWHYNSNGAGNDRTIIVQPLKLRFKNIIGAQLGIMTRFIGVYLSVSKGFLGQSYTFFMGVARHAYGVQLSPTF
jgi:hypothetical protein